MARAKIVVVGSSNTDMVVRAAKIAGPGETILGGEFIMVPGGKGANQAVCAAKLGADVKLVARVGDDVFGQASLDNFHKVGIDTKFVTTDREHPSGIALISVDAKGENAIVVAPGANNALSPEDVDRARETIAGADILVLQLEIPSETVAHAVEVAKSVGTRIILNPAPIRPVSPKVLGRVDVLTPNQHEAAELIGLSGCGADLDPKPAADKLRALGVETVVITLGSKGAFISSGSSEQIIPAQRVKAVDTTAAGDAFTAALATGIAEGLFVMDAARFAAKVAAISVTRLGAQNSMPSREEVQAFRG